MELAEFATCLDTEEGFVVKGLQWSADNEAYFDIAPREFPKDLPEGVARIHFTGIEECHFSLEQNQRVNRISVETDSPLLWNYGPWMGVYGNAPLPDSPRFFLDFYRLVKGQLDIPRDPSSYLNWEENISQWFERVSGRSYLLLRAPAPLAEQTLSLLDAQAAEYTILPEPITSPSEPPTLAIKIDHSWLTCQTAQVQLVD